MTWSLLKLPSPKRLQHIRLRCGPGDAAASFSRSAVLPKPPSPPPEYFHSPLSRPLSNHCQSPSRPIPPLSLSVICPPLSLLSPNHGGRPPLLTHLPRPFMRAGTVISSSARAVGTALNAENSKRERRGDNRVTRAGGGKFLSQKI